MIVRPETWSEKQRGWQKRRPAAQIKLPELRPSHKRQRCHADADRRREYGTQGNKAGMKGTAGGEYIIDQEDVADAAGIFTLAN